MLRVTIEMVPHGRESKKWTLATAVIANDGSGTETRGNYSAWVSACKKDPFDPERTWRDGIKVKGFPRTKHSAWRLLYRVLRAVFEKESK